MGEDFAKATFIFNLLSKALNCSNLFFFSLFVWSRLTNLFNAKKNKLEQLRALDNKLKINVALAKSSPIGVDTEEDYLAIKKIMEYKL